MAKILYTLFLIFLPKLAYAHSGSSGGFSGGFFHPVLGLDHLLAMVSVGILSTQIGGRAILTVPTTFVIVMAIGGLLGIYDVKLISVELGIALSVFLLGTAIAFNKTISVIFAMIFVGIFAIFHGYAHGAEMPENSIYWSYIIGFMFGTAALHIIGLIIGHFLKNEEGFLRYIGAVIAGMGLHIILQMYGV